MTPAGPRRHRSNTGPVRRRAWPMLGRRRGRRNPGAADGDAGSGLCGDAV